MNYPLLYLEHLSQRDFELLAQTAETGGAALKQRMLERPEVIDELLASRRLFDMIFDNTRDLAKPGASSFLSFAALVNRSASDLHDASYVSEWAAPGKRLPVFDVEPLRHFLDDGARRYFLIEFLNSFTSVASGSFVVQTRDGIRRKRFSELDPVALAEMVELLPPAERPGGYRRLGDVALFLSGVLPDHTARHPYTPAQREWLAQSAVLGPVEALAEDQALHFIEAAGAAWYRRSVDESNGRVSTGPTFLRTVADRFSDARRILNYLADRYLFRHELGLVGDPG
ncbi:MAG TPA: hypothetical protein VHM29_08870 [Acidimicrobiia bacterium]|jgi:hypothetical protein|nr:hypothetical protein [Acidimicrobiia bacterium]